MPAITQQYIPRDEDFSFQYLKWQKLYETEKPFQIFTEIPDDAEDKRDTNCVFERAELQKVHDVRAERDSYSLDVQGFQFRDYPTTMTPELFFNTEKVEGTYFPECEAILRKELEEVDDIIFFDWRLRSNRPTEKKMEYNDRTDVLTPNPLVHVDQSPDAVERQVRRQRPKKADAILKNGRVRIVNIWRPFGPVEDSPLALCDARSVNYEKLIPTDHIRKFINGRTLYATYDPGMHWCYLNNQQPNEITMLKNFDSKKGVAQRTPHSAFTHSEIAPDATPRESIEIRALILTYPKEDA